MKTMPRIFAIFLFAFTQCFAPLVHAHVDGVESNSTFHTHDIPHASSTSKPGHCQIETQESQAISIAHEYQRDIAFVIPNKLCTTAHPVCVVSVSTKPYDAFRPVVHSFQKPPPQAPPQII